MAASDSNYAKVKLLSFLDFTGEKGLIPKATAQNQKSACIKLLEDVEDADDVRKLDIPTQAVRYNNRHPGLLSPDSLRAYESRALRAVQEFLRYTESPRDYKPASTRTASAVKKSANKPK